MSPTVTELVDLRRLLFGSSLRRFLEETARFYSSLLLVQDETGKVIARIGETDGEPKGVGSSAPIIVCEETLGQAIAIPQEPTDRAAADALARHAAGLVAELAMKEYELSDLSQEILDIYEEVNLFYDLSSSLGTVRNVSDVCEVVLGKACEIIRVARASILLQDVKTEELYVAAAVGMPDESREEVRIPSGQGISGKVLVSGTPRLVDDVGQLPSDMLLGHERYATRSFLSVPLCIGHGEPPRPSSMTSLSGSSLLAAETDRAIGVLNMTDRKDGREFTSGDLKLLTALAVQAAVLIENIRLVELEKELRVARNIQQSLLPISAPDVPGVEIAGVCHPARNVGGDYFDYHLRGGTDDLLLSIADVSGHNLASALMMAVARSVLRSEVRAGGAPGRVLGRLNRILYEDLTRAELFLSLFLCRYDPATGCLEHSSAGHPPALVYRPSEKDCLSLTEAGLLAGVLEETDYPEGRLVLSPGDILLAYTDGLLEAADAEGRQYGLERLSACLKEQADASPPELIERIFDEVRSFRGDRPAADDMTAIVLKVNHVGRRYGNGQQESLGAKS